MRTSSTIAIAISALICASSLFAEPSVRVLSQFAWNPNVVELCEPTDDTSHVHHTGATIDNGIFVECQGSFEADDSAAKFGGLSGLEVFENGTQFISVSDTGVVNSAVFERDSGSAAIGARILLIKELVFEDGKRPEKKRDRDTEGLAIAHNHDGEAEYDGSAEVFISAESKARLLRYEPEQDKLLSSPLPPLGSRTPANRGFEALAHSSDGALIAIAESSQSIKAPFEVFKSTKAGGWSVIFDLPRSGGFRPVGADFGPDDHLYILTRAFNGFAFASRIERVIFQDAKPVKHQRLFQSRFGQFDNLEGLAVWRFAPNDLRLYAVSDDNFSSLQTTQIVEFHVQE